MQNIIPDTRSSLILRLHDPADHDAWETFVSLYEPVVYRLARRMSLQDATPPMPLRKS
jgi:hypothetical protein